jgi:hypothetical protein
MTTIGSLGAVFVWDGMGTFDTFRGIVTVPAILQQVFHAGVRDIRRNLQKREKLTLPGLLNVCVPE